MNLQLKILGSRDGGSFIPVYSLYDKDNEEKAPIKTKLKIFPSDTDSDEEKLAREQLLSGEASYDIIANEENEYVGIKIALKYPDNIVILSLGVKFAPVINYFDPELRLCKVSITDAFTGQQKELKHYYMYSTDPSKPSIIDTMCKIKDITLTKDSKLTMDDGLVKLKNIKSNNPENPGCTEIGLYFDIGGLNYKLGNVRCK